jgi:hypothetical protein
MTSPENLGPQFKDHILLHRGLSFATPRDVDLSNAGVHWTEDHGVAQRFAETGEQGESGLIVHGAVHPEHVVKPGDKDWEEYSARRGNQEYEGERETSVREGSPVTILGLTSTDHEGNPVKVNMFKKPRVGRA